ncbi:pyridoxamine 5'-phosphate oxidase family protein [Clostridium niameyense]|uniref:Pyridoxamine 5'-phosphate oxidase family protein n=1 Tax=Clostridium niameyense TaxID=1622073 RepID=A0A6M0RBK4_9CLOT|nr:pyridoxamine 5'-phosphate oxidase family protein [Clostridium niameyense]NEZ46568.1 pyridoxamine 5'-phosphate oxidase family protein [Clostridium niameyense]
MFKKMRRKDKIISKDDIIFILNKGNFGILSTVDTNGYGYGVPLNYVYKNNSIYFHCAPVGEKLENIKNNNKVSFCVTNNVEILNSKFDTNYESVIIFGKAYEIFGQEKDEALLYLIDKYSKDFMDEGKKYIENSKDKIKVIKIDIEHSSGKAQK